MHVDTATLGDLLLLAALLAATALYAVVIDRRAKRRREEQAQREAGLQGLVRTLGAGAGRRRG